MLVLTRKTDESIIINGNIKILILKNEDGKVKLGIEAPEEITIYREELFNEIKKANEEATLSNLQNIEMLKRI